MLAPEPELPGRGDFAESRSPHDDGAARRAARRSCASPAFMVQKLRAGKSRSAPGPGGKAPAGWAVRRARQLSSDGAGQARPIKDTLAEEGWLLVRGCKPRSFDACLKKTLQQRDFAGCAKDSALLQIRVRSQRQSHGLRKKWLRRWFVLDAGVLMYFDHEPGVLARVLWLSSLPARCSVSSTPTRHPTADPDTVDAAVERLRAGTRAREGNGLQRMSRCVARSFNLIN